MRATFQPISFTGSFTPAYTATGVIPTQTEWSSYTDANNEVSLNYNGVIAYLLKRVAGVNEYVTVPYVPVDKVPCNWKFTLNSNNTMNLWINNVQDQGGLGGELVINGTFDSDLTGWTDTDTGTGVSQWNAAGYLELISTDASNRGKRTQGMANSAGKAYVYTFNKKVGTGINTQFTFGSVDLFGAVISATGVYTGVSIPPVASMALFVNSYGNGTVGLDDISIKEVQNNTTTLAPVFGTTQEIGSKNGGSQVEGTNSDIRIYNRIV